MKEIVDLNETIIDYKAEPHEANKFVAHFKNYPSKTAEFESLSHLFDFIELDLKHTERIVFTHKATATIRGMIEHMNEALGMIDDVLNGE